MPQLAIVIPFNGIEQELESTLISVLENRPYQCEIIVVHQGDYADPYDLGDEVKFLELNSDNEANQAIQFGEVIDSVIGQLESPILHLLACGTQVVPGWTDQVNAAFDDPYVGSICPVLLDQNDDVYCLGVENTVLYQSRLLGQGKRLAPMDYANYQPVGPSEFAAFYRVEALREIDCLTDFSNSLIGLEIALALEAVGYESELLESSIIKFVSPPAINQDPYASQLAIWRFAGSLGLAQGVALTFLGLSVDLLTAPFRANSRKSIGCRLARLIDVKTANRFREFVEQAQGPSSGRETISIESYDVSLTGSELTEPEQQSARRAA